MHDIAELQAMPDEISSLKSLSETWTLSFICTSESYLLHLNPFQVLCTQIAMYIT